MKVVKDLNTFQADAGAAVAIGKFDGVHRGHQELLRRLNDRKKEGMISTVFTFVPSPEVFFGLADANELTGTEEKRAIFTDLGVDVLVEFPMNSQTASILPEEFVRRILVGRLNMRYICAGTDLRFGRGGRGNSDLLLAEAECFGYETDIISKLYAQEREISSSFVREEVERGNMSLVSHLLGRAYRVEGKVVEGTHLGRTWGIPTANLIPPSRKILPPCGVYYVNVRTKMGWHHGISNVGYKPTVCERMVLGVETFLYDFQGDLYGETIQIFFLEYKRKEMKWQGIDRLIEALNQDISDGRAFFQSYDRLENSN